MLEIIRFEGDVEDEILPDEGRPGELPLAASPATSPVSGTNSVGYITFVPRPHGASSDLGTALPEDRPPPTGSPRQVKARSVALCRGFVEELVNGSLELERGTPSTGRVPEVDWEALWACGDDAGSLERAVGRAVLEADRLANEIRGGTSLLDEVPGSPPPFTGDGATIVEESPASGVVVAPPEGSIGLPEWPPPVLPVVEGQTPTEAPPRPSIPRQPVPEAHEYALLAPPEPSISDIPLAPLVEPPPSQTVAEASIASPGSRTERRRTERVRRRRKLASFFGWVQFTGVLLFLFVAWQLWGTGITQHHAQAALAAQFNSHPKSAPVESGTPTLVAANVRLPEPAEGSVVARLQIPAIGVEEYVVEGTAEADLGKGPGHYVGTSLPGQAGNVAIAGHRTTYGAPFYDLNELVPGDVITLTTDSGLQLRYVESQKPFVVSPRDVSVLNYVGDNRLTLTTCNPRFSSTQRLVAVAILQTPVSTPVVTTARSDTEGKSESIRPRVGVAAADASVGWHLVYLPEALLFLAILVLLGALNKRAVPQLGNRVRWLVLGPMWLAVIYLMFGALTNLLPATL